MEKLPSAINPNTLRNWHSEGVFKGGNAPFTLFLFLIVLMAAIFIMDMAMVAIGPVNMVVCVIIPVVAMGAVNVTTT